MQLLIRTKTYSDMKIELYLHCQFQQIIWITSINLHGFVCPANERVRAKTMQKVINGINKKILLTRINSYRAHI